MPEEKQIEENEKNNKKMRAKKYKLFRQQGLFMFPTTLKLNMEERKVVQEIVEEYLLELMYMHQAYHDVLSRKLESQYALRGSKIKCSYGTKSALLDCVKDHGVLMGSQPVLTCRDCDKSNIYNFGSCMCPEKLYMSKKVNGKPLPMTAAVHPNGEPAMKAWGNLYAHICVPLMGREWLQEETGLMIEDNNAAVQALVGSAVLTCQYGGMISIKEVPEITDEQSDGTVERTKLGEWLEKIEAPYKDEDYIMQDKIRIAIKPHDANDGYVTIGNGHAIQSEEDAEKYGFKKWEKQSIKEVQESIKNQLEEYGENLDNPAILTLEEARILLETDLLDYHESAENFASETELTFSENEMDGMTSLLYNGNNAYNDTSLLYYFLRKDAEKSMKIMHKAVKNGWYKWEGTLRRRLMEYNIFFNNDYTFYDLKDIDNLKEAVGWKE